MEIKLRDEVIDFGINPEDVLSKYLQLDWRSLEKEADIHLRRTFSDESLRIISTWVRRAIAHSENYSPPNFSSFITVEGNLPEKIEAIIAASEYVEGIHRVESADRDLADKHAYYGDIDQRYLGDAPVGVGARYVWDQGYNPGEGVRLVDVERGWTIDIDDFVGVNIKLIPGGINQHGGHGTKVLAIIAANRDGRGSTGIAYGLESIGLAPTLRNGGSVEDVPNAIVSAGTELRDHQGDVLLLEVSRTQNNSKWPIEVRPAVFSLIQNMVARGICVVEPAGNGCRDISGDLQGDSGAIIVGSVQPIAGPSEKYFVSRNSNFGERIDCYAWGDRIFTSGPNGSSYFDGTSGASAIVAGVVAVSQSVSHKKSNVWLSPSVIRSRLRQYGTDVWWVREIQEGKVPDLKKIVGML